MENRTYSILYPDTKSEYKVISAVTLHDLGMDQICKQLSAKTSVQNLILNIMSKITDDPYVTQYRCDVFEDILLNRKMREDMLEILGRIDFLKEYGGFQREYDEGASMWELMHRLDEIKDYIDCVDALFHCLSSAQIQSEGLRGLYDYVNGIYSDHGFAELKKDILALKATTSNLKSITVGINLNERYEADGIGLLSVNSRYFTKSGILSNFYEKLIAKDQLDDATEWDGNFKFHPFGTGDALGEKLDESAKTMEKMTRSRKIGMTSVPENDQTKDITKYMDRIVNHMLSGMVKRLKDTLNRYVSITITDMTDLIPEFMYYIHWAEYIERYMESGASFCKPAMCSDAGAALNGAERNREGTETTDFGDCGRSMKASGLYNIRLVAMPSEERGEIVVNDLDFDEMHRVYILTGANRGGKTTITQAIGQLFVLAQGGIYVPARSFAFSPVDMIFTHFPADEDKTMDLGRLGEECKRFREMYRSATKHSLLLLNESFSTTSFEEGYYIARDAVKAILYKGIRTIYNTHMHKLAFDIDEINQGQTDGSACSLTVVAEGGKRSYKVELGPPAGKSFADDIAKKYGVTFELLKEGVTFLDECK